MVLNYIWIGFFLIALVVGLVRLIFLGDTTVFTSMVTSTFDSAKSGFEIALGLTGVLTLWLGLMKVGEQGGVCGDDGGPGGGGEGAQGAHCAAGGEGEPELADTGAD